MRFLFYGTISFDFSGFFLRIRLDGQGVICRIFFNIFSVDIFRCKGFDSRENGHAHKHPDRPHEGTANQHCKNNPKGVEVNGIAQNFRPEVVPIKLLQNQNKDADCNRQRGIDEQRNQDGRDCTDKRPEIRNHIRYADNQAENQRIGGLHQIQPDKRQNPDNQRINCLADDEILEDIGFSEKSENRKLIEKFVDENPDAAALLLRNWLNDDWE